MAEGIVVPQHVKDYTRDGVYGTLKTVPMIKEFNGAVDEAIDHFGLRAHIENEISVLAAERAYVTYLTNILNSETFNGAYAHLAKKE